MGRSVAAVSGITLGAVGVVPPAISWLEIDLSPWASEYGQALAPLYISLLPFMVIAALLGACLSVAMLFERDRVGRFWVLAAWCFAVVGTVAPVWWILDALSDLGSLGGL